MGWQEDREIYIQKLDRIVSGADKLLALPHNRVISVKMRDDLGKLRNEAEKLQKKLTHNEFEIAVVGVEKSGKSSFANALIKLDTLPTSGERCTYTTTCIRSGDENSARVTFYTAQDLEKDLRNKLEILNIPDPHLYNLNNLDLDHYEHLYSKCSPEIKQFYGKTVNQDIRNLLTYKDSIRKLLNQHPRDFKEEELSSEAFKAFIKDPEQALAVKEIVIFSTSLAGLSSESKTVLYDVPGFDSPTDMHKKQTFEKMDEADVIIAVANAEHPSINGPALDVWTRTDSDDRTFNDKLFVFANRLDMVKPQDLEKHKSITRDEWLRTWRILPENHADRILMGSAAAAMGDQEARAKLVDLNMPDGVSDMWHELEQYNRTARFEVLKARVGKILRKIEDLFEPVNNYESRSDNKIFADYGKLLLDLTSDLRCRLDNRLAALKEGLNSDLRREKPLSQEIRNRVEAMIQRDKYGIVQEELQKAHNKVAGISAAEQPTKIDPALRSERFEQMYGDFCSQVQSVASKSHNKIKDQVADVFMESMELNQGHTDYDDMRLKTTKFCNFDKDQEEIYYSTLLERFARDLFEALIMFAHGPDRWHKFREEQANFISMGVFFDSENNDDVMPSNPADSLFWRLLLYPDLVHAPKVEDLVKIIQEVAGLVTIGGALRNLLGKVILTKGVNAANILKDCLGALPKGRNEAVQASEVRKILESIVGTSSSESTLEKSYLDYVHEKHKNYSYETVQQEFDQDVDALRRVLISAFVPAVNIDKAFAARESRLIEQIIQKLDGEEFHNFLAENVGIIRAAQIGEMEAEQAQRQADEAVAREVKGILADIERGRQ